MRQTNTSPSDSPLSASMKLFVLGDSHVRPARHALEQGWFGRIAWQVEEVGGATAVGLRHPTSKTQALVRFRECLLPFNPDIVPVFQLGEVDCGFVIWVRAQRHNESVVQQLAESLQAYRNFLCEMRNTGYENLIVTSAMLPTLLDGALDGVVAHLRREVKATMRERTDLTLEYNERLRKICHQENLLFADFTPHLLDPTTRTIKDSFRHPDPADHHLHPEHGGRLWVELVGKKLQEGPRFTISSALRRFRRIWHRWQQ